MSTGVIQIASLTAYANAFLQGHPICFDMDHSLADICHSITFIECSSADSNDDYFELAKNPNEWFQYLKKQRVERVKLHFVSSFNEELPDRIGAAFVGGGGRWLMETLYGDCSDLWESGWTTTRGARPWKVYYLIVARDWEQFAGSYLSLRGARRRLSNALINVEAFAREQRENYWAESFRKALETLDAPYPLEGSDFVPRGCFSLEAEQLFAAGLRSWVFGGMGSWNDLCFGGKTEEQYVQFSNELYDAMCQSLVVAINSYPSSRKE